MSGSWSFIGEVTDAEGVLWAARVFTSRAMVATRSPPVSLGLGAVVVLVAAKGLLTARMSVDTGGTVAQVMGIFESKSVA